MAEILNPPPPPPDEEENAEKAVEEEGGDTAPEETAVTGEPTTGEGRDDGLGGMDDTPEDTVSASTTS